MQPEKRLLGRHIRYSFVMDRHSGGHVVHKSRECRAGLLKAAAVCPERVAIVVGSELDKKITDRG